MTRGDWSSDVCSSDLAMTNKYEPAKLNENASPSQKARWQEQVRRKRRLKREKFRLVLERAIHQNKILIRYFSTQRGERR